MTPLLYMYMYVVIDIIAPFKITDGYHTACLLQFLCAENELDTMSRIDEPESCRYVITVHTMRICHHPYLKLPAKAKPKTILCYPLLMPVQYDHYMHQQTKHSKRYLWFSLIYKLMKHNCSKGIILLCLVHPPRLNQRQSFSTLFSYLSSLCTNKPKQ